MAKYIDAEKLKAEIKRLKGQLIRGACAAQIEMETNCKEEAYDEILSFLYTLESEKPMQEGLENEAVNYCFDNGLNLSPRVATDFARHFAQWGAEHAKIDVTDYCKPIDPGIAQCIADHSWEMLEEDEKPVPNDLVEAAKKFVGYDMDCDELRDYETGIASFIAGAKWQKEQMLKEAVEGTYAVTTVGHFAFFLDKPIKDLCFGDKVRVIVCKKED